MNNFPKPPIDNMGGVSVFYFSEASKVNIVSDPVNNVVSVVFKTGYDWLTGYSAVDELKYQENKNESDHGIFNNVELSGFIPESDEIRKQMLAMEGKYFIVNYIDNDDNSRLAGNFELPLLFTCDFDTQTASGIKGYRYKFSGVAKNKAPIYNQSTSSSSQT